MYFLSVVVRPWVRITSLMQRFQPIACTYDGYQSHADTHKHSTAGHTSLSTYNVRSVNLLNIIEK